jgi:hypothetical protein
VDRCTLFLTAPLDIIARRNAEAEAVKATAAAAHAIANAPSADEVAQARFIEDERLFATRDPAIRYKGYTPDNCLAKLRSSVEAKAEKRTLITLDYIDTKASQVLASDTFMSLPRDIVRQIIRYTLTDPHSIYSFLCIILGSVDVIH